MDVKFDTEARAMYIKISEGAISKTEELTPDTIMIDKNSVGQIIGVEIIGIDKFKYIGKCDACGCEIDPYKHIGVTLNGEHYRCCSVKCGQQILDNTNDTLQRGLDDAANGRVSKVNMDEL